MTQPTLQQVLDQGLQHHKAGRLHEAEGIYRRILSQHPEHFVAMHYLGLIAHQVGKNNVAANLIRRAIAINPNYTEAHGNLGLILRNQGQLDEAIGTYQRAIALNPNLAEIHNNLGIALAEKGRSGEAIAAYHRAISLNPNFAEACNNLGNALKDRGDFDDAIAAYRRAIVLNPNFPEAHNHLGIALEKKGQLDEAMAAYQQAIFLKPNNPEAHSNLGNVLSGKGQRDEAIAAYERAIALNPNYAVAHDNLGSVLQDLGRWQEALEHFRKAVALDPDNPTAQWNLSRLLLLLGHAKEGWALFDSRLQLPHLRLKRSFPHPQWDGSDPAGKTILLHAEGGHGDTLNFIRLVPEVAQRGAKLILECQPALVPLFTDFPGLERVIARGQPLPGFDWQIPLQSLPHVLGVTLENIPNQVPYITPPADRVEYWKQRLAIQTKLRVGLVWSGSPNKIGDRRTQTVDVFAPLAEVPGVKFFSLQTGADSHQAPSSQMDWADFSNELTNFAETAALVQNLDLVISVDTSVAHLAGALAKPVWVLIPFQCDFRWLLNRTDIPWYPTMRLFRQCENGDWNPPIAEITAALREFKP